MVIFGFLIFHTFSGAPAEAYTYSNNFEGDPSTWTEWNYQWQAATPTGGRKFLGIFSNHTATLTLPSFGAGVPVSVEFDLFILQSWDGNSTSYGPDYWKLFSGSQILMHTTFSNVYWFNQSYPGEYYNDNPYQTGAVEKNTLGYTFYGDAVYHITKTFTHSGGPLVINFQAYNLQGWTDEGWGLDNVQVTVIPLPGTGLLMGSGLLGLLSLSRRRQG